MTQPEYTDQELVAMPRVNIALLDRVLDYIIEHPDEWNQGSWANTSEGSPCGTTYCFAGTTCYMTDADITLDDHGIPLINGGSSEWGLVAQERLGLTEDEADALFIRTIFSDQPVTAETVKAVQLQNVKVEVERIRHRAKMQEEAFNRIAQEFIDSAGLDDVVKPGYECPESEEAVKRLTGGERK